MSKFEINQCVNVHDVDFNGVARTSAILRYIQTAADSQIAEHGMDYEGLRAMKRGFIISRIRLEIYKTLRAGAELIAKTYPCESRGFGFLRCYELECDGECVAKATSLWALIDTEKRSLVRVSDFELPLPHLPPLDLALNRFRIPDSAEEVGVRAVSYGEVDRNMHMNNTKYPDIYSDYLPMAGKRISSITINYANEAPLGEKLSVHRAYEGEKYYFRTAREDGSINSEAEITLCDI